MYIFRDQCIIRNVIRKIHTYSIYSLFLGRVNKADNISMVYSSVERRWSRNGTKHW